MVAEAAITVRRQIGVMTELRKRAERQVQKSRPGSDELRAAQHDLGMCDEMLRSLGQGLQVLEKAMSDGG